MDEIRAQAEAVAEAREAHLKVKGILDEIREAWETEHKDLLESVSEARAWVAEVEDVLRALALEKYGDTGGTKPGPGRSSRACGHRPPGTRAAPDRNLRESPRRTRR